MFRTAEPKRAKAKRAKAKRAKAKRARYSSLLARQIGRLYDIEAHGDFFGLGEGAVGAAYSLFLGLEGAVQNNGVLSHARSSFM